VSCSLSYSIERQKLHLFGRPVICIVPLRNVTEICGGVSETKHGNCEECWCKRSPLQLSDVGLQQAEDTLPALVNDL